MSTLLYAVHFATDQGRFIDPIPSKLLFLPGASGNTAFWRPAAERLAHPAQQVHIGWPGFGSTPPDPSVTGLADLVARVRPEID